MQDCRCGVLRHACCAANMVGCMPVHRGGCGLVPLAARAGVGAYTHASMQVRTRSGHLHAETCLLGPRGGGDLVHWYGVEVAAVPPLTHLTLMLWLLSKSRAGSRPGASPPKGLAGAPRAAWCGGVVLACHK